MVAGAVLALTGSPEALWKALMASWKASVHSGISTVVSPVSRSSHPTRWPSSVEMYSRSLPYRVHRLTIIVGIPVASCCTA